MAETSVPATLPASLDLMKEWEQEASERAREMQSIRDDPSLFLFHVGTEYIQATMKGGHTFTQLYPFQRQLLMKFREHEEIFLLFCRFGGKSWLVMIYCLWQAVCNPHDSTIIISYSLDTSRLLFDMINVLCESPFLKQFIVSRNREEIRFKNGSFIKCIPQQRAHGDRAKRIIYEEIAHSQWKESNYESAKGINQAAPHRQRIRITTGHNPASFSRGIYEMMKRTPGDLVIDQPACEFSFEREAAALAADIDKDTAARMAIGRVFIPWMSKDDIVNERLHSSTEQFRIRVLAEWVQTDMKIYDDEIIEQCLVAQEQWNPQFSEVVVAFDWGLVHGAAFCVGLVYRDHVVIQHAEIHQGMLSSELVQHAVEWLIAAGVAGLLAGMKGCLFVGESSGQKEQCENMMRIVTRYRWAGVKNESFSQLKEDFISRTQVFLELRKVLFNYADPGVSLLVEQLKNYHRVTEATDQRRRGLIFKFGDDLVDCLHHLLTNVNNGVLYE